MDQAPIRFGIVSPTLTAERYLDHALRSVWDQRSTDVEIDHVLVDGGSRDRTLEIARRYPTRVVVSTADQGMYDAVNRGMTMVEGEVVNYINDDDEIAPGGLAIFAKAFREHPQAEWLIGTREFIDENGRAFAWMTPVSFGSRSYIGLGWSCVNQESAWMRRSFFDRVGPYDIKFRNCGDYDWFARAIRLARPLVLKEVLGRFRLHGDQLSFDSERMAMESRRVQEKNGQRDLIGFVMGKVLSLRLNASNSRWLVAKKTGRIRYTAPG